MKNKFNAIFVSVNNTKNGNATRDYMISGVTSDKIRTCGDGTFVINEIPEMTKNRYGQTSVRGPE